MPTSNYDSPVSEAEYLRVEEADPERHEYVAGRMFAMVGASLAHNMIVSNLVVSLLGSAKRAGCKVVSNAMKVKVESVGAIYYPDVVASCEKSTSKTSVLTAPCLIIEVLSVSTMSVDRPEKLMAYRTIPCLKEYLLIDQDRRYAELYRKSTSGEWEYEIYKSSDRIRLTAIGNQIVELSLNDIYSEVDIDQ